jgi:hypothetical protein
MPTERVFCTVGAIFVNLNIPKNEEKRAILDFSIGRHPCPDCHKYKGEVNQEKLITDLSKTVVGSTDAQVVPTGTYKATIAYHEDYPGVPDSVAVGDPIVMSCLPGIKQRTTNS